MDAAPQFSPTHYSHADVKSADHFTIEDLLDFPNDDVAPDAGLELQITGASTDSSTVTLIDTSCNSFSPSEPRFSPNADIAGSAAGHFSGDLFPYEDLPELEWLSNFVEESFSNSSEDFQKLHLIHGIKTRPDEAPQYQFQPESGSSSPILRPPAKARSKRSRAAPGDWASRLHMLSLPQTATAPTLSSSSESDVAATTKKTVTPKKKEVAADSSTGGEGRRCLHCETDKTPQWRTGPMGPKTLCNACGVRYKSGRLVPEYRPAASPSFSQAKHSNSHRKVLELRRQKEMQLQQRQPPFLHHHHHQNMVFDVSNGDDYLIHQHIGPDYRQQLF